MIERSAQRRGEMRRALYSPCERYRYLLEIAWLPDRGFVQWLMLNPSTATETEDDPTIRRCKQFAKDWGYGGIWITNVAAWRSTSPHEMSHAPEPIGQENTPDFLAGHGAPLVVAGWGNWAACERVHHQLEGIRRAMGARLHALGLTKAGHPAHPLYLRGEAKPKLLDELEDRWQ